jgi:hypothetical protein
MITTVTYYRNHVEVTRNVVVSVPTLSSGNQVSYENEAATAAPVPHRAEIETAVTYSATMTKQRYRIDLETPELPNITVVDFFFLRPDGVSFYRRPDGTSRYVRA